MHGQLWQECEICGTEPVCSACFKCIKHCTCDADAKAIREYHDKKRDALHALMNGMERLDPVPSGIKFEIAGEKVDFSPWGGGVYEYYTPIIYTMPESLAGKPGVEYYEYIGGEDSTTTRKYWIGEISDEKTAAAKKWQDAEAAKKARDKELSERHLKEYREAQAKKDAKQAELKAKEDAIKDQIRTLDLSAMTKAEMLVGLSALVKKGIVRASYTKPRIIEAVNKYLSGKTETTQNKHREKREYPDY